MDEFSRARLDRLLKSDNAATSPKDALALAGRHLEEHGTSGNVLVVIEKPDGGTALYSSQVTVSAAVYLLESAKLSVLIDQD